MIMINAVASAHDIQEGTVTLGCDNESALWVSFGYGVPKTGDPSADIIKVIRHELSKSTITWQHKHVKGHQDNEPDGTLDD